MKKHFLFYPLVAIFLFTVACNQKKDAAEQAEDTNEQKFDNNDQMEDVSDFMVKAYTKSMLVSEASQMAAQKAKSPKIKEFAQKSLDDHNKVKQQLQTLAGKMNVTLPDSLSNEDRNDYQDLTSAKQDDFDKKYVNLVEDANEKLVKEFEDVSDDTKNKNADVSNFVQQTLPTLRQNKEQADQLEESV